MRWEGLLQGESKVGPGDHVFLRSREGYLAMRGGPSMGEEGELLTGPDLQVSLLRPSLLNFCPGMPCKPSKHVSPQRFYSNYFQGPLKNSLLNTLEGDDPRASPCVSADVQRNGVYR